MLPATVTFERKQYQPFGLARRMVFFPITLTAGRTSTSAGYTSMSTASTSYTNASNA